MEENYLFMKLFFLMRFAKVRILNVNLSQNFERFGKI